MGEDIDAAEDRVDLAVRAAPERSLRVLIVEDHEAIARGLELLLRREAIEIAGSAGSLGEARRLLERRAADVVVLDITLQDEDGLKLVPIAQSRGVKTLVYTGSSDPAAIATARAAGADGVATKVGAPAEFVDAVRRVANGEPFLDPRLPAAAAEAEQGRLTAREREIVSLLAQGLSGEDIAVRLFLAPATVRTHIRNAMNRTDTHTRAHLIALAARSGEISID